MRSTIKREAAAKVNTQRSRNRRNSVPGILSSEIGRFGGAAHNLEEVEKLRIMAYQGEGAYEADVDNRLRAPDS